VRAGLERPDVVVLDPPRAGAGRDVMEAVLELRPRTVGYVSCDPATLARDVAVAAESGWQLVSLRAFDAFPMTAHVECVAALVRPAPGHGE
jgi:tRNA/tmRNA/rRNA uracil-C5-methylase (TrmA/RlmC/RlmD family)